MINMLSLELNLIKIWAEILFFSPYCINTFVVGCACNFRLIKSDL
jgi:hypothetical protein